jgi:hypothetical protein
MFVETSKWNTEKLHTAIFHFKPAKKMKHRKERTMVKLFACQSDLRLEKSQKQTYKPLARVSGVRLVGEHL